MPDPTCFNANCHPTVLQNIKADQLLPHVKDCFQRGGTGLVACIKCLEAFAEGLKAKQLTSPPTSCCQICAGVNGKRNLHLHANGEYMLWICEKCISVQRSVISANFYVPQKLIPVKEPEEVFTFDLPKDAPKKRFIPPAIESRGFEPPSKVRRLISSTSFAASRQQQPWETIIINATNQQESKLLWIMDKVSDSLLFVGLF